MPRSTIGKPKPILEADMNLHNTLDKTDLLNYCILCHILYIVLIYFLIDFCNVLCYVVNCRERRFIMLFVQSQL